MSNEVTLKMSDEAVESLKNQAPLNNVYESSDFVQGINRGKFLERTRIIQLLEDYSVKYCTCDEGFICEPHRYIAIIKGKTPVE
jgi:hypothetical protein